MPWPDFAQIRVDRDAERAHPKGAAWVQEDVRQERARMEGILQLAIDDRYGDAPFPRQLRHFLNRLSIPLMADHRKELQAAEAAAHLKELGREREGREREGREREGREREGREREGREREGREREGREREGREREGRVREGREREGRERD